MESLLVTIVDFISTLISGVIDLFLIIFALSLRDFVFYIVVFIIIPTVTAPLFWLYSKLFGD